MGPEAKIQSHVVKYARSKGILCYKFNSDGNRGVPDYLFIHEQKVMFIEFKAPGKEPTALQKAEHGKIMHHQIPVHVCDDKVRGVALIDAFLGS